MHSVARLGSTYPKGRLSSVFARIKKAEQSFPCHESVAAFDQRRNQLPIDRGVHPQARPQTTPVRRRKEMLAPQHEIQISRRESERDRWSTAHHLESAERLAASAKVRMTPRRRFCAFWKRETQAPRTGEWCAFKGARHSKPAVNSV